MGAPPLVFRSTVCVFDFETRCQASGAIAALELKKLHLLVLSVLPPRFSHFNVYINDFILGDGS